MKTMSLVKFGLGHVDSVETEKPIPGPSEVLVKVLAYGVCYQIGLRLELV
jgi:D-arabinose 1-dehydrogenase-like Zn-dependent alcohol dehydrogenase